MDDKPFDDIVLLPLPGDVQVGRLADSFCRSRAAVGNAWIARQRRDASDGRLSRIPAELARFRDLTGGAYRCPSAAHVALVGGAKGCGGLSDRSPQATR